jgi:site-specific DNA-methyltransferase (adenine-specific)
MVATAKKGKQGKKKQQGGRGHRPRLETVEQVPTKSIRPHDENERIYGDKPDAMLVQDMAEFGVRQPIIVEKKSGAIISGRRRHAAAVELKLPTVPVIYRTYEDHDDLVTAIIEHNRYRTKTQRQLLLEIEALSEIEDRRAKDRLRAAQKKGRETFKKKHRALDSDHEITPEPPTKIGAVTVRKKKNAKPATPDLSRDRIGAAIGSTGVHVQRARTIINEAKARSGKKWMKDPAVRAVMDGKKTISRAAADIHRERREKEIKAKAKAIKKMTYDVRCQDHIRDVEAESCDAVVTDPPYGLDKKFRAEFQDRKDMTSRYGDWDEELGLEEIAAWTEEWARVLKTGGSLAVFCSDRYVSIIIAMLEDVGFKKVQCIVWTKTNPAPQVRQTVFTQSTEYIVVGVNGEKRRSWNWMGHADMMTHISGPICGTKDRYGHPTAKPPWLIQWLLERLTNPGDIVLDPFAGSGSTGAVAKRLGRQFILVEREKKYIKKIKVRLAEGGGDGRS